MYVLLPKDEGNHLSTFSLILILFWFKYLNSRIQRGEWKCGGVEKHVHWESGVGWGGGRYNGWTTGIFSSAPLFTPPSYPCDPHLSLSKEVDRGESRHLTPSSALLLHQSVTTAACYGFTPSPSPSSFLLSTSSSLTPPILLPASSLST